MNESIHIGFHNKSMDLLDEEDAQEIANAIESLEEKIELLEKQVTRLKQESDYRRSGRIKR